MATARTCLFSSVVLLASLASGLLPASTWQASHSARRAPTSEFNPKSVRVYVSAFDINAAPAQESAKVSPPASPQKPTGSPPPNSASSVSPRDADSSAKRADRLKTFFGDALLQALRKSGFNTAPIGSSHPEKGVLLKGVFAEVDSQNHNCLAILGATNPASSFVLYVGAYNLARPDQPLYRVMTMENCDAKFGPVITLNNYVPMDEYAVSKNPTEDEVRKVCAQIVANLRALLSVNSAAFSD